jgi:AraC-like DNA-binding protein
MSDWTSLSFLSSLSPPLAAGRFAPDEIAGLLRQLLLEGVSARDALADTGLSVESRPAEHGVQWIVRDDAACADAVQLGTEDRAANFAPKVHRALRLRTGPGAGMAAVASSLNMTDRTLRRHLAEEGTSFSAIADQVRYSLAAQQLQRSDLSIEDVAELTGFSDPANFRRAFLRWTGMTPARFRQSQRE